MKLGELRGAIRKMKGNPSINLPVGGVTLTLVLQKTPLLDELERQFPGGKAAETPLELDEERGLLLLPIDSAPGTVPADDSFDLAEVDGPALDDALDLDLDDDDLLV